MMDKKDLSLDFSDISAGTATPTEELEKKESKKDEKPKTSKLSGVTIPVQDELKDLVHCTPEEFITWCGTVFPFQAHTMRNQCRIIFSGNR